MALPTDSFHVAMSVPDFQVNIIQFEATQIGCYAQCMVKSIGKHVHHQCIIMMISTNYSIAAVSSLAPLSFVGE